MKRYGEAITEYERAIRLKGDYAEAHFSLGVVQLAAKRKSAALAQHSLLKNMDADLAKELYSLIFRDKILRADDR